MKRYWNIWFGALFLKQATYDEMSNERYAFAHGLTLIIIIGGLVGGARIVGAALRYLFSPPAAEIKNTVLLHLVQMPWYLQLAERNTAFASQFLNGYNQWWRFFGDFVVPNPYSPLTLASLVTVPLYFALAWLIYGSLVHLFVRVLGGQGNFGHGLGTLALASAPQVLAALTFFPGFSVGVTIVALWTMILNYVAVRTNYRLSAGRAFLAAFLPIFLFALFLLILILATFAILARGGGRQ